MKELKDIIENVIFEYGECPDYEYNLSKSFCDEVAGCIVDNVAHYIEGKEEEIVRYFYSDYFESKDIKKLAKDIINILIKE